MKGGHQNPGRGFMGALTVDGEGDGFPGAGVEVSVLSQACVVACVHAEDPVDGVLGTRIHLGVVVEPNVLTWGIRRSLT